MRKIAQKIRTLSLIAVSAAGLLAMLTAANVRPLRAEEIDSVVASVDGDPITSEDLKNLGLVRRSRPGVGSSGLHAGRHGPDRRS